jgi:hypothetical protein
VGIEIMQRFDEDESLKVTVLSIMGKDMPVSVMRDVDV